MALASISGLAARIKYLNTTNRNSPFQEIFIPLNCSNLELEKAIFKNTASTNR
jgi:hypothetical protein